MATRLDQTVSIAPAVLPTPLQPELNATYASFSYGDRGTEETHSNNITGPPTDRCFSPLLLIGLALVLVASSTGNAAVLYIIGRHLKWRTATNVFITVLSLSDLVVSVTCVPLAMASVVLERPALGETGYVVSSAISKYFGLVSAGMTTMLTVDRYQVVVRLRRSTFTECRTVSVIVAVTSSSFLLVLPSMVLGAWRARHGRATDGTVCLERPPVEYRVYEALYTTVCFTANAACMAFCVFRLVRTIRRSSCDVCPHSTHVSQLRFVGEIETARTVVVMVILFVVFRTPYAVAAYLGVSVAAVTPSAIATQLLWWANGAVNPIVYAVRNPNVAKILQIDRKSGYVSEEPVIPCNNHPTHSATGAGTSPFAVVCAKSDSCRVSQTAKEQTAVVAAVEAEATASTATLRSTSLPSVLNFVTSRLAARNSVSSTSTTLTNVAV